MRLLLETSDSSLRYTLPFTVPCEPCACFASLIASVANFITWKKMKGKPGCLLPNATVFSPGPCCFPSRWCCKFAKPAVSASLVVGQFCFRGRFAIQFGWSLEQNAHLQPRSFLASRREGKGSPRNSLGQKSLDGAFSCTCLPRSSRSLHQVATPLLQIDVRTNPLAMQDADFRASVQEEAKG